MIVPPPVLAAVAVNVTGVPAQIAPVGIAAMETVGVRLVFTIMVMVLELAVVAARHVPPATVISHVILSPVTNVVVVKVVDAPF